MRKRSALLLTLFVSSLLLLVLSGCGEETVPLELILLPEQWGAYTRTAFLDEKAALEDFDRQHKKRVPIRQGVHAWYEGEDAKFEVWVASGRNEKDARKMIDDMTNKLSIAPEHIFSKPEPIDLNGVRFYRSIGQEMTNFYYAKDHNVYFIQIARAPDLLKLVQQIHAEL